MNTTTITCGDCGAPYETIRRNTKLCAKCRLLKNLMFLADKKRNCWLCKKEFAPIDSKDVACGDCTYEAQRGGKTECVFCHEPRLRVRPDVDVCNSCARDPQFRGRFITGLRKSLKTRLNTEYSASEPEPVSEAEVDARPSI